MNTLKTSILVTHKQSNAERKPSSGNIWKDENISYEYVQES